MILTYKDLVAEVYASYNAKHPGNYVSKKNVEIIIKRTVAFISRAAYSPNNSIKLGEECKLQVDKRSYNTEARRIKRCRKNYLFRLNPLTL